MILRFGPLALVLLAATAWGQAMTPTRTAPPPTDARQAPARGINTETHPLPWGSPAAWQARRAELREQMLVAAGLWPEVERPPLQPHFVGEPIVRDGYTIERVWFETRPGMILGGNLYRPYPLEPDRQYPAVLITHGHGAEGRFVQSEISNTPARAISFAKFGAVAFSYDMIGYLDTGLGLDHYTFGKDQPIANLYGLSPLGLQTYNSQRALDFVCSLPEVDPTRLGVTGQSGGGTQTFMLCAVDDRPLVASPVVMVSLHMAGGCICENAPGLRVGTDNVQITALHSPKPLLLVAAKGDWTKNTPTVEGPYAKEVWALQGAPDNLDWVIFEAPHNNNLQSREAVYAFFGRHLFGATDLSAYREPAWTIEPDEDLLVFPDRQPPPGQWAEDAIWAAWRAQAQPDFGRLAELGIGLRHSLAVEPVAPSAALIGGTAPHLVLGRDGSGERVEATWQAPSQADAGAVVLLGQDADLARALAATGRGVLSVVPFAYDPPRDPHSDEFTGYNQTELACRVQDALTAVAALRARGFRRVELVGTGREAAVAVLAAAWADIDGLAADLGGLDVTDDSAYLGDLWQPSLRAMGDVRTAALLAAQRCDVRLGGVRGWSAAWAADGLSTSAAALSTTQVIETLSTARSRRVEGAK